MSRGKGTSCLFFIILFTNITKSGKFWQIEYLSYFSKGIRRLAKCHRVGSNVRFAWRGATGKLSIVRYQQRRSSKDGQPERAIRSRTHLRHYTTNVPCAASSDQVNLRHTRGFAYRCFLPDLTGFTSSRCTGPSLQRHFRKNWLYSIMPGAGIKPCYSGLQVQGTATSPPSAIFLQYTIYAAFALVEAKSNVTRCLPTSSYNASTVEHLRTLINKLSSAL